MGRTKTEKRKRKHSHKHHSSTESDSDDSVTSSSDSSSTESESGSSSSDSSAVESRRHGKKEKKKPRRSSGEHKKRKPTKHKKKEKEELTKRQKISLEDYFLKSAEFRVWLLKERKIYFNDLSSEQSRQLFKKFVRKWNNGLLKRKYYQGIQSSAVGHESQSQYQWKFASGMSGEEVKAMRANVSSWTAGTPSGKDSSTHKEDKMAASPVKPKRVMGPQRPGSEGGGRVIGPSMGPASSHGSHDPYEREERRDAEHGRVKKERKELRKHHEMVMEELVPKATGREAQLEKKKRRAEQRRDKELSPEADESLLMGASGDYVGKKIRKRQTDRQHRAEAASQKIADYQAREKARATAILEMAKAHKKEGAMW